METEINTPGSRQETLQFLLAVAAVVLLAPAFYFFLAADNERLGMRFLCAGFGVMFFNNSFVLPRRSERIVGAGIFVPASLLRRLLYIQ